MGFNLGDILLRVLADLTQFDKQLQQQAQQSGDKAGKSLGQRISANLGKIGGASLGAAFVTATAAATTFEDELRTIQTVAPDLNLDKAKNDILALSRETGKSTSELASGFYDLVSAGISADDAISVLRDSAKFATGALSTTGEAVDLVTSVLNSYGLAADQSARVTDVFAKAVADGKVTAAQLAQSMAQIAPIAASAGVSIEEVSAGFAFLTKNGVPATQAATQMRAAISALLTPNEQLNKIQEATGINFQKLAREKGLAVALDELRKATAGSATELDKLAGVSANDFPDALKKSQAALGLTNSEVDHFIAVAGKDGAAAAMNELTKQVGAGDSGFAKALGSIDAYNFALITTGGNLDGFSKEIVSTTNSQGLATEQYDIKSKSAVEQGKRLVAQVQSFLITMGGPFVSTIGPAVFALNQLGGAFGSGGILAKAFGATIGAVIGGLAQKLGPGLNLGFQKLLTAAVTHVQIPAQALLTRIEGKFLDVFAAIGESSAVQFVKSYVAKSALGQAIGGVLTQVVSAFGVAGGAAGTAFTVAAAAAIVAAPLIVLKVALDIQGQVDAQGDAVLKQAQDFAKIAKDADLQRAIDNTLQQLDQIPGNAFDAKNKVVAILNTLQAEQNRRITEDAPKAQKAWQDASASAVAGYAQGVEQSVPAAQASVSKSVAKIIGGSREESIAAARASGKQTASSLAEGMQQGKEAVSQAWHSFLDILKNQEAPTHERARLLGELASDSLAHGLHSKDAYVREQAEQVKNLILQRLSLLKTNTKNIGAKGMEELRKGMKSKDPEIRAAATAIYNAATGTGKGTGVADLPAAGTSYGEKFAKQLANGMTNNASQNALITASKKLAGIAKNNFQLSSPAKEGPWSEKGGPEGWGERFTMFLAKGMVSGTPQMTAAASAVASAGVPAPVAASLAYRAPGTFYAASGVPHGETASTAGAQTVVNVKVDGLMKARDPFELAQRLQRFASTGVFSPQPVTKPGV